MGDFMVFGGCSVRMYRIFMFFGGVLNGAEDFKPNATHHQPLFLWSDRPH
jgi:hypothetical protein